jgi:CTP synthase (UTP-ammonia lyase)
VLVEHARNLLEIDDAAHAESSAAGTHVITPLSCSLDGQTIEVLLTEGSRLAALYGNVRAVTESTTCNYGLAPEYQHLASEGGMAVSGVDDTGEVRAVERIDHPFFVATLYQPQLRSTPAAPHPVFAGFVAACVRHAGARQGR